ncbi:MAG: hypothetical protein NTY09_03535 [bacterium]|nr:hypothetical protein [bacterium]
MSGKNKIILDSIDRHPDVASLLESVRRGDDRIYVNNIKGALKGILSVLAHVERAQYPTLVVTSDPSRAKDLFQDASFMLDYLNRDAAEARQDIRALKA